MYLFRVEVNHCDIWFIRFCVDYHNELLALGNTAGKIFIWDLKSDETTKLKYRSESSLKPGSSIYSQKKDADVRKRGLVEAKLTFVAFCDLWPLISHQ